MVDGYATIANFNSLPTNIVGDFSAEFVIYSGAYSGPDSKYVSNLVNYSVVGPTPPTLGSPKISITSVSKYGSSGNAKGKVSGVNTADYGSGGVYSRQCRQHPGWWGPNLIGISQSHPSAKDHGVSTFGTGGVDAYADESHRFPCAAWHQRAFNRRRSHPARPTLRILRMRK